MDPFDEIVIKTTSHFRWCCKSCFQKKLRRIEFLAKIWQRILCLMS